MIIYNIGANIGFITLILSQLTGTKGRIVAFEPNPEVCKRLIEHVLLNNLENHICVEKCALSDFDGVASFSLSLGDTRGRFEDLLDVKPGFSIQVPCKPLNTYVEERELYPDFIFMDVEYAEGRVLRGMSQVLEKHKPIILIEMHGSASIEESFNELKKHKYFLYSIPDLRIVTNLNKITRGHYLSVHSNDYKVMRILSKR